MSQRLNINADIITWAINRAGHDLQVFLADNEKINAWIEKTKLPTVKQLEEFAKKVHIPFGYLFLQKPPKEEVPIPFSRTGLGKQSKISLNVFDTILIVQQRQEWLSNYLKENGAEPLNFVGKFTVKNSYLDVLADMRKELGLNENWAFQFQTWEKSLEHLTQVIEDKGIILNFNGVVGNNTRRPIAVKECRGFVMVDDYAPFLFVNSADAKAAQMFTIVHELAHIWLGESAGFDFKQMQAADDPIEKLCDQIAAEFLVAEDELLKEWQHTTDFKKLAKHFKVSPIVIGRRALDIGLITRNVFFSFYNAYIANANHKKENQTSGGSFYNTAKKRISLTFAAHVNNAVKTNTLLFRDAYKLTGLKGDTYSKFLSEHHIN